MRKETSPTPTPPVNTFEPGSEEQFGGPSTLITRLRETERALRQSEQTLKADLEAMQKVSELGSVFVREDELQPALLAVVDAAIAITGADFGSIQLLDPTSGDLRIAAQRGFSVSRVKFWDRVSAGKGTCGTALHRGERVVVFDLEQSEIFAVTPWLEVQRKAGVRAVQSTPLVTRAGWPIGIFSTHCRTPQRPDARMLVMLDLLARQAADLIERAQVETRLHKSETRLREVFESTPFEVWVRDEQGRCIMQNAVATRHWGNHIGKRAEDSDVPEAVAAVWQANNRRALDGQVVEEEVEHVRDGQRRVYHNVVAPLRVGDEIRGILGFNIDITEAKRAEENLKAVNSTLELRVVERTKALEMLHDIASMANQAQSTEQAIEYCLQRTAMYNGWCF
jgi:PAS domain S-box-containing protein